MPYRRRSDGAQGLMVSCRQICPYLSISAAETRRADIQIFVDACSTFECRVSDCVRVYSLCKPLCVPKNLSSGVAVMKSAKDGM